MFPLIPYFSKPCKPSHNILHNISFTARPSELLAVVGPSGAGKSTLLDILAARTAPSAGSLLLNSSPLHPSSFRKLSVYVPQHDLSLYQLTVLESFTFAARLLIVDCSIVQSVVLSLLSDLRLSHLANTRLSDGLSGGERRRVSIGLSLLHDPAVLILDEPTSGLDSSSAFNVVQSLKAIAVSRKRTVVLSIHQPSFKILSFIDSILLLSKGAAVHHGSMASLDQFLLSNGFVVPSQLNPLEYAMEILDQLPPTSANTTPEKYKITKVTEIRYRSSRVHEITTLYCRFWKIIYRSKQLLLTNMLEALIVGFLLGTIYINVGYEKQGMDKRLGFFAFTLTFLLSSTTETLPIFVSERPILLQETSSGVYRLSSHLIANTLVFLPYLLSISILYSASVYFIVGLCMSLTAFTNFILIVWSVMLTANSFVLFISSIAPNYIAGTSLVTISLAGFFLFSGYFLSKASMPVYWLFMHYLSPYKYGLDALLANEYECESGRCFEWADDGAVCQMTGKDVLEKRGLRAGERWENVEVLFGFFVFYRVLYWVVLTRRASRSKQ